MTETVGAYTIKPRINQVRQGGASDTENQEAAITLAALKCCQQQQLSPVQQRLHHYIFNVTDCRSSARPQPSPTYSFCTVLAAPTDVTCAAHTGLLLAVADAHSAAALAVPNIYVVTVRRSALQSATIAAIVLPAVAAEPQHHQCFDLCTLTTTAVVIVIMLGATSTDAQVFGMLYQCVDSHVSAAR
eukprot:12733-Heterococcus_DN1.PRE.8